MKTLSDLDIINTPDDTGIVWVQDPTSSTPIDRRWPVSSIKALMVNTLHPVGSQYHMVATVADNDPDIAFPTSKLPEALWPGTTWALLWDGEGVFFRTEGDSTTADNDGRVDGRQQDQMQRITGDAQRSGTSMGFSARGASYTGAFSAKGGLSTLWSDSGTGGGSNGFDFNSADSPDARASATTAGETRPVNRLIRIYERTA